MRNLKVFIAYNGAAYHGFQRQDNAMTVQEAVENSIGKLLKIPAPVIYFLCQKVRLSSTITATGSL